VMLTANFAARFAADWIEAWNSQDLERILAHYTDEFEMSSPVIARLAGEPSGRLRGKENVAAYWRRALRQNPGLRFELITTLTGADSITLYYAGPRGLSAEVFHFGPDGRVSAAFAHYEHPER